MSEVRGPEQSGLRVAVERKVILEFKTADQISKAHEAQLTHFALRRWRWG